VAPPVFRPMPNTFYVYLFLEAKEAVVDVNGGLRADEVLLHQVSESFVEDHVQVHVEASEAPDEEEAEGVADVLERRDASVESLLDALEDGSFEHLQVVDGGEPDVGGVQQNLRKGCVLAQVQFCGRLGEDDDQRHLWVEATHRLQGANHASAQLRFARSFQVEDSAV